MPENQRHSRRPAYSLVFLAAGLYLFIISFKELAPILLSFLLVIIISLALNPVISRLRDAIGHRSTATLIVLLVFAGVLGLTAWGFYAPVKQSTAKFVQRLPEYWERIQRPLLKLEQKAAVKEQRVKQEVKSEVIHEEARQTNDPPEKVRANIEAAARSPDAPPPQGALVRSGLGQAIGGVTSVFKSFAANAATITIVLITTLVGVIFTLLNPRPLVGLFFSVIPEKHHASAMHVTRLIVAMLPRWALATLLGMVVIGVMVFLALWPILGLQDALVLGLIACVLEAVPFIGPLLAVIPGVLLAVGKGGNAPLWVILAYIVIQQIENHIIAPVIIGGRLKLQPLAVIFSILVCVTAFGVLGVLVAVPAVAIANIILDEVYRPRFSPNTSDSDLEQLAREALGGAGAPTRSKRPKKDRRGWPRYRRGFIKKSGNGADYGDPKGAA